MLFKPSSDFIVPKPLEVFFSCAPSWPGSVALVAFLNLWVVPQMPEDVAEALEGQRLQIFVRDVGIEFNFRWTGQAFLAIPRISRLLKKPSLIISAKANDFWQLYSRKQDPDTLFFARKLLLEGDTELGLMVKNMLDSLELPVIDMKQKDLPSPSLVANSILLAVFPLSMKKE